MSTPKGLIRRKLLARRALVSVGDTKSAGLTIVEKLDNLADWVNVKSVHVYHSMRALREVDTEPIVAWIQGFYPNVEVFMGGSTPEAPMPKKKFTVIIVPTLGFGRDGFRMGMGGGWYDRWLATQPQAIKIGLAYSWAEVEGIKQESHDVLLDVVLSEREVIICTKYRGEKV